MNTQPRGFSRRRLPGLFAASLQPPHWPLLRVPMAPAGGSRAPLVSLFLSLASHTASTPVLVSALHTHGRPCSTWECQEIDDHEASQGEVGRHTSFGEPLGFLGLLSWVCLGLEQRDLKPRGRTSGVFSWLGPLVGAARLQSHSFRLLPLPFPPSPE